jgi:mitochondrial import receptor subunit TOM40
MNDEEGFMMARVDPERGTVDGRIHRSIFGGMAMAKLQVGTSSSSAEGGGANDQLLGEIDFGAMTWTANLKYGSMGGGNIYGMNYYQQVSPRLALGAEGMYVAVNGNMLSSYTAKLSLQDATTVDGNDVDKVPQPPGAGPPSYLAATYNAGQGMVSLNYKKAITPSRVNVGVSLECSPMTLESQVVMGAEFNLTRSKMNVCIDGTGRIQSVLEAKLGREPGSPSLNFAAELDHGKGGLMRFGYGLNIGS